MEKLKVLHIHEVYTPYKGGSAIRIENLLINQFAQFEDKIDVICSTKGIDNEPLNEVINNIRVFRVHKFRRRVFLHVINLISHNKYDYIHVHNTWLCFLIFPLFLICRRKIVLEIHSLKKRSLWKQQLHEFFIKISPKIVVLSKVTKEYLVKNLSINPEKILVVINGINLNNRTKEKNLRLRTKKHIKRLVYFGSLYKWQGTENILNLCHHIEQNDLQIKITIIGEGPEKRSLTNSPFYNKCLEVLDFMPTEQLYKQVLKYDAFLYLRPPLLQNELTFPLKILELGNLGIPIICTNRQAHFEVFRNGSEDDYLNIIKNDFAIPEKIMSFLRDDATLKRRALSFKEYVLNTDFSWKNSARIYRKSYI
ncbi:MAG: glycosyltransferase family 4 protein [Bacteroidetes bacterium]|nr:glycosyltransferase family 4 protein [Bacteroidota bacterium]